MRETLSSIVAQARADRAFLARAIRYLTGSEGIRQFLDIGTGLPTADNTHEVAQRLASQIQALDRTQPILPVMPGVPERQTHDYKRNGTTTLFAALEADR